MARRQLVIDVCGFDTTLRCHEITLMYLALAVRSPRVGVLGPATVDISIDRPDSLHSSLIDSPAAMLAYGKSLIALSRKSGPYQPAIRAKAAEAVRTALWLALNEGSVSLAREIMRTCGPLLGVVPQLKGRAKLAYQMLRVRVARRAFS